MSGAWCVGVVPRRLRSLATTRIAASATVSSANATARGRCLDGQQFERRRDVGNRLGADRLSVISSAAARRPGKRIADQAAFRIGTRAAMRAAPNGPAACCATRARAGENSRVSKTWSMLPVPRGRNLIHEFAVSAPFELRHDGAHHFAHVCRPARNGPRARGPDLLGGTAAGRNASSALISAVSVAAASERPPSRISRPTRGAS